MAFHGDSHVITCPGVVIWDGFTRPEDKRNDKTGETFRQYTMSIAIPANAPEAQELNQILTNELNSGEFKGKMPAGGHWGVKPQDPAAFEGALTNHIVVKAITYQICQVYSADSKLLDPMMYGPMIYPGAKVQLLVSARSYNNVSKGVGFWLGGIRIVDAKAPRLAVGGVDAGAAFASVAAPAFGPPGMQPPSTMPPMQAAMQPGAAAPPPLPAVTPHPGFLTPPPPAPPAPVKQMTPAAQGATYEAYVAAGWSDAQLVANGLMVG